MGSPYQNSKYEMGKTYNCKDFDSDKSSHCGAGLNVATLDWCLIDTNKNLDGYVYIEVSFNSKDIVAIPYQTDGKFRIKKMKIERKLTKKELQKYLKK